MHVIIENSAMFDHDPSKILIELGLII